MQELAELERRFWLEGPSFYREWLSQACVLVFPGMAPLRGAEAVIGSLDGAPRWTSVDFEPEFVWNDGEGVLITYEATAAREGAPRYRARAASLYIRESGAWRLRFHQQTPAER
jgi:hypothetical protein